MTAEYKYRLYQRIKQLYNGKWRLGTVTQIESDCITVVWDKLPGTMAVTGTYNRSYYKYFRSCVRSER